MALIFLRISAKTPTITMGETGIGKTAVIKVIITQTFKVTFFNYGYGIFDS